MNTLAQTPAALPEALARRLASPAPIPAPATEVSSSTKTPVRTIRALAFAGGGYETVNQLGVIHAMIVGRCQPPDLVVGISGGAVNAVSLAEVLQAGESEEGKPDPSAQVARFREIFEAVRSFPSEYLYEFVPDPFEVDARAPLQPQSLPLNSRAERDERNDALSSRFGVIRLLNDILAVDLPLSRFTRMVRRLLEWRRLAEETRGKRWALRGWHAFQLWCAFGFNIPRIARPLMQLGLSVLLSEKYRSVLKGRDECAQASNNALRKITSWLANKFWRGVLAVLGFHVPASALDIMRHRTSGRIVQRFVRDPLSVLVLLAVWAAPILVLVALVVIVFLFTSGAGPVVVGWPGLLVGSVALLGAAVWIVGLIRVRKGSASLGKRLLRGYDLAADLATPYAVKRLLVRLYDPGYYGRPDLGGVVDQIFGVKRETTRRPATHRTLASYASDHVGKSRIHIRPLVADLQTGKLAPVAPSVRIVDALLAACASAPFLRPQAIQALMETKPADGGPAVEAEKEIQAIDARNITNDPLLGIFSVLAMLYRQRDPAIFVAGEDPRANGTKIEIYPVTSLPDATTIARGGPAVDTAPGATSSAATAGATAGAAPRRDRTPVCDEIRRALRLQQFRDWEVGAHLAEIVNGVLPAPAFHEVRRGEQPPFVYVKAATYRIRPSTFEDLNSRVLLAKNDAERRDVIARGVANGCRDALKVFMKTGIARGDQPSNGGMTCRMLIRQRMGDAWNLPGSDPRPEHGPGIAEVCANCPWSRVGFDSNGGAQDDTVATRADWPVWGDGGAKQRPVDLGATPPAPAVAVVAARPAASPAEPPIPPAIGVLFSGGVFRGVFQVGVIAALERFGFKPQVIGGASVGSIMSAMAARILGAPERELRERRVAELAATFLCVDRLVLTDRFSDFVREFTLRAAGSAFSLTDLDQFFRRFDEPRAKAYSEGARRVLAGLERLFYANPFEVVELARSLRSGEDRSEAAGRLGQLLQYFLDESGIGQEILGAEPLQLLLEHHVFDPAENPKPAFDLFRRAGMHPLGEGHLLATATNLNSGALDILGFRPEPAEKTILAEGLLASSAFPGVFRPRWSWEVYRDATKAEQWIDGGVMDNLPIKAVVDFLEAARVAGKVRRTGANGVPHLLFTASLEPETPELKDAEVKEVAAFWRWTARRAQQLKYNKKVADYARVMRDIRQIVQARQADGEVVDPQRLPLDLELVCVVPKWLCGTFEFHPMLGFRRAKQARSIAHGCAMTLGKLHLVAKAHRREKWLEGWSLHDPVDDECVVPREHHPEDVGEIRPKASRAIPGGCWLCAEVRCPFSTEALRGSYAASGGPATQRSAQVSAIHKCCCDPRTHQMSAPEWGGANGVVTRPWPKTATARGWSRGAPQPMGVSA